MMVRLGGNKNLNYTSGILQKWYLSLGTLCSLERLLLSCLAVPVIKNSKTCLLDYIVVKIEMYYIELTSIF